jgi:uncharacterized protein YciI
MEENKFKEVYALIWKANKNNEEFKVEEFESRIPGLMNWLKDLHSEGKLIGCGGGGFENHAGGLTLIQAGDIDEARKLSSGSPMNEIGTTEIFLWDVYYADLSEKQREHNLLK